MSSETKPQTLLNCRFSLVLLAMEFSSETFPVDDTTLSKLYLFTCILTKSVIQLFGCSPGIWIAVNWAEFCLYIVRGNYFFSFNIQKLVFVMMQQKV